MFDSHYETVRMQIEVDLETYTDHHVIKIDQLNKPPVVVASYWDAFFWAGIEGSLMFHARGRSFLIFFVFRLGKSMNFIEMIFYINFIQIG